MDDETVFLAKVQWAANSKETTVALEVVSRKRHRFLFLPYSF
jgi:hypothetical protein